MATREQVTRWAEALIQLYLNTEWTFRFDHARTRAGMCNYTEKVISVSKFLLDEDDDAIHQVLLHEIAHALAGPKTGHGPKWRSIADDLGYVGGRLHTGPLARDTAPWRGVCPNGHELHRFRKPRGTSSCSKCSPRYNPAFLISWTNVPV